MSRLAIALLVAAVGLGGCVGQEETEEMGPVVLGPVDGHDLPGADLERIQVGQTAPDFSLASLAGPVETLSSFRGKKNVVLVFYRGSW